MSSQPSTPHVTWDEETIALHDKDRGTRMKIEEPKTPFHYYGSDGEERGLEHEVGIVSPARSLSGKESESAIEWNELQVKLEKVKEATIPAPRQSEWDSSDDEGGRSPFAARDAEGKKVVKDPKFVAKRKSHYNEYQQMKMWRAAHHDDDDGEDDDDEKKNSDPKTVSATAPGHSS